MGMGMGKERTGVRRGCSSGGGKDSCTDAAKSLLI